MRNRPTFLATTILSFATAASVHGATTPTEPFVAAHGAIVPATYRRAGEHLDLWPEQRFHLVRTPADGATEAYAGRWHAEGGTLVLEVDGEPLVLTVRNAQRLVPPGAPDDASADLVTEGALEPASLTLPAAGMFTYFADAPTFVHCATGHRYPVAQEGAYPALEAAYLEDRPGPAEPLFVTIQASIATREQMEGPDRPTVTVERFDGTWPGEDCDRARGEPPLADTVWRLRSLGDERFAWTPPASEPFLVLRTKDGRFNASVGCNAMFGGFTVDGEQLTMTAPASTMMACPDVQAQAEARLGAALGETASYVIGGRTLRLLDAKGATLAAFEAVYRP